MGDCTGHGISAANIRMKGYAILEGLIKGWDKKDCAELLGQFNEKLMSELASEGQRVTDGMDLGILSFNTKSSIVQYSGARMDLYVAQKNRKVNRIKGSRSDIGGVVGKAKKYLTETFHYNDSDRFYLFSDGIKDQYIPRMKERLNRRGIEKVLKKLQTQPLEIQDLYFTDLFSNVGKEVAQIDDLTILGFHPTFDIEAFNKITESRKDEKVHLASVKAA
jgi:serine phosphatase RsbU (regulator of sigma subunit)